MISFHFSKSWNKTLLLTMGVFLFSCNPNVNSNQEKDSINRGSFDWLLGKWKRVDEEPGKSTFENWIKINELEYKGFGFTMLDSDTIWQENLALVKTNENWRLEVISPNQTTPTVFVVARFKDSEFVCENPEHDFPTMIKYWREGQNLRAAISGGEMEISFEFVGNNK